MPDRTQSRGCKRPGGPTPAAFPRGPTPRPPPCAPSATTGRETRGARWQGARHLPSRGDQLLDEQRQPVADGTDPCYLLLGQGAVRQGRRLRGHVLLGQGRQGEHAPRSSQLDELVRQAVRGRDVGSDGAEQQQGVAGRHLGQVGDQVVGRSVHPLKIVEQPAGRLPDAVEQRDYGPGDGLRSMVGGASSVSDGTSDPRTVAAGREGAALRPPRAC